jgi:hypothetical protein
MCFTDAMFSFARLPNVVLEFLDAEAHQAVEVSAFAVERVEEWF